MDARLLLLFTYQRISIDLTYGVVIFHKGRQW